MVYERKSMSCAIIAITLVFADIFGNGNLNLLYFLGAFCILFFLCKQKYFYEMQAKFFLPLVLMAIGSFVFSGLECSFLKATVYLAKMFINIALFVYVKNNLADIRIKKVIEYICVLLVVLLCAALILRDSSVLWRLNDPYNDFSKTRLQLLFSEPSVLGLFVGTLIIFVVYSMIECGITIKRVIVLGLLVSIMILTFSMSGIVFTTVAVGCLFFIKIVDQLRKGMLSKTYFFVIILGVFLVLLVVCTDNPIGNRFFAIIGGQDGSFHFRWSVASKGLIDILHMTNYAGLGLGNMNTAIGRNILLSIGIDHVFSNSFLYFVAETGAAGALYIIYIIGTCLTHIKREYLIKQNNIADLKVALLMFVFIYQVAGGYFTDPLTWCLYGVICSKSVDKKMISI